GRTGALYRRSRDGRPRQAGVGSPMLWGTEDYLGDIFGEDVNSIESVERTFTFRFASPEEFVDFFKRWYGPTLKAFAALEGPEQDALESDLVALARRFDRIGDEATAIPATYLQTVAIVR